MKTSALWQSDKWEQKKQIKEKKLKKKIDSENAVML